MNRQLVSKPPDHDTVCNELLSYLQQHPNAMDSLRGIADWWLPQHRVRVGLEQVERALRTLEARGLIERVGDESQPLFRLKRGVIPRVARMPKRPNGNQTN